MSSALNALASMANASNSQSTGISDSSSFGISGSQSNSQGESWSNSWTNGTQATAEDRLNAQIANQIQNQNWLMQAAYNSAEAKANRQWQEEMSNTAYQRAVQDLKKAGITYTDSIDEMPWQGTLQPDDMTRFMKNLRKIFERKKKETNIRFMGCGEYGENTRRPHYHLILFNCNLPKETFYEPHVTWNKDTVWKNTWIERAWGKGMVQIGECNWNSIAYVARYITKKINGNESEEFYAMQGEEKEFFRTSNQPGIGGIYYENNKEKIYKNDKILIQNLKGVHWIKPPEYFDRLYEKEYPEKMQEIKEKRKKEMYNQLLLKGQTTTLTRWEQLQIEKSTKEDSNRALKRDKTT